MAFLLPVRPVLRGLFYGRAMTNEVTSIGVGFDTSPVKAGIDALYTLAQAGPKVERALDGVEKTADKATKKLKTLGEGAGKGLAEVGAATPKAADGLNRISKSADDAQKSITEIRKSAAGLGAVSASAQQAAQGLSAMAKPSQAAAQSIVSLGAGAKNSQASLAQMQAAVLAATQSVQKLASEMGRVAPSMHAVAAAQESAAKAAVDMGKALQAASKQTQEFGSKSKDVADGAKSIGGGVDSAASAVGRLNSVLALAGAGMSIQSLISYSDGYTKLTAQLRNASQTTEEYSASLESVKRISNDAQMGAGELATLYARIASSTREMGISQKQVANITETVALSLKANGAGANEAASAMLQLSQAFGSGVLRGEEFNAVYEAAPNLLRNLADAMKVPQGALREMASDGKLTAEVLAKYLPESLEKVRKEAEQMQTISGSFTVLNNKITEFVGAGSDASGAAKAISSGVVALANNLDLVSSAAGAVALVMTGRYVGSMKIAQAETIKTTAAAIAQQVALTRAAAAIGGYSTAATAGMVAMSGAARAASIAMGALGGPVGLAITAIGLGAAAFYSFGDSADDAKDKIASLRDPLDELTAKLAALPSEKRVSVTLNLQQEQQRAVEDADAAVDALIQSVGDLTNMRLPADEWSTLRDRVEDAAKSGKDLTPILAAAANSASLPEQYLNKWLQLAGNLRVVQKEAADAASKLASITGAAGAGGGRGSVNPQTTVQAAAERWASQQWLATRNEGISKQFIEEIEGYAKALASGAMQADEYAAAINRANKKRHESTEAGKAEAKALKESEKWAKSGTNAYATLSQKAADYVKTLQLETQQGSKITQSQKLQLELNNLTSASKGKVSAATVAQIQASIAIAKAMEGEAVATKRAQEAYQEYLGIQGEIADYDVARSKALESARLAMDASETTAREALRRMELEASLIGATTEKRAVMLAQLEEEIRLEKELAAINALDTTEANRDELRKRARAVSAKNIAVAEGKAYIAEWDKTSQLIGDTLADYIMGGGKDAAAYLKRLFSTLVLQPVVQTLVSGVMGTGAAAGGGAGAAGAISSGQSIWSAFSGNMTAGVGSTIASLGASLGSSAATAFGSGIAAGGQLGLTAGLSQGASLMGAGGTAAGLGTMAGAAMPWVAGAMALYSIAKKFDNSGTLHYGAGATYSGGKLQEGAGIYNQANFGMGAAAEWNAGAQQNVSGIASALGAALDSFAVGFGKEAGYTIATAFADDSSKDGAWGSLRIADAVGNVLVDWESTRSSKWAPREFGDGEQGYQDYLKAVAVDVKSAFLQMDIPGWGRDLVEAATDLDSLSAALAQIGAIQTAFDALGRNMQSFVSLTDDMQTQLLKASGGIEALSGNAAAFYESYYTEAERMQNLRKQVNASLESLGVSLGNPLDVFDGEAAKEAFRRNFEEAMATGQGELAAAMLALNQDFAAAANYADKLGDAVSGSAKAMQAAIDALSDAAQSALSARSTASSLLGQIGSATGNGYASQRESQLWAAMGSAQGYKQQIDLASELTDLVLGRYEAEKQLLEQNAAIARQTGEQQMAFARQLGDYVQSLLTGSLSPLTNAQKLAQAQQNYQAALSAAQGGDTVAQGNLQNVSNEYLQLARMYFASGDEYTKIFESVSSQLQGLSSSAMSEAQRQISIAEQSLSVSASTLGQLGLLQGILESAYAQADADYIVQTDLLQEQLQAMLGVKGGVDAVAKAVASMPTELAVLFNGLSRVDGSHAGGLSYVPFDGYRAELHKGERVLTAAENSAYRPDFSGYGRGADAALVAEVKALRTELTELRRENREDAAMQARATVNASQLNAQEVVHGVGGATERAAYQGNMGVAMR